MDGEPANPAAPFGDSLQFKRDLAKAVSEYEPPEKCPRCGGSGDPTEEGGFQLNKDGVPVCANCRGTGKPRGA
jgi:hypothetical protein